MEHRQVARHHRARIESAVRCICEPVERRLLLCGLSHEHLIAAPEFDWQIEQQEATRLASLNPAEGGPEAVSIIWSNRGLASDNFTATFGTSAAAARAVVDAALAHWERVITSWNRADGTSTLQVNISISGTGYGGAGAPSATAPADGKPRTGSFTLAAGRPDLFPSPNDSNGWYLDPNPNDHAEFATSITNAFAGRGTGLGSDMYSVVAAELTHVLGLISDKNNNGGSWNGYRLESSGLATNTNIVDNAEGGGSFGRFWVFQGPTVDHLMTSYNSGDATSASWGNIVHSAGVRSTQLSFGGKNWQGSEDVGNASYSGNERTMPSWTMAHILRDAYGYSIIDPNQFDTFHANLNRTSGLLTIRGGDFHNSGAATSNDEIIINRDGSELVVSVDVSNDIPGTRHLSGAGNLPAWVTRFPLSAVNSIVVEAGAGNDTIRVLGLGSGMPMTINAGSGSDVIDVGGGDFDTNISSNIVVNAGSGSDSLVVNDLTDGPASDIYNISATQLAKSFGGVLAWNPADLEAFSLIGSGNNDTINFTSASSLMTYSLGGSGGNDTFSIGNGDFDTNINGNVTVSGGTGTDQVIVNDTSDAGNDIYQLSGNRLTKSSGAGALTALNGTETMIVNGSNANNTWSVPQLSSFLNLTINAGSGNDSFSGFFNNNFDANLSSMLAFNGGAGTDSIVVNDQGSSGLVYNLTNNRLDKGGSGILMYSNSELFTLNCNAGNNTINILSTHSSTPPTINGNSGDDTLNVNDGSSFLFNFGSDITFNGGPGSDTVDITDTAFGGTGTYTVNNGHVALPFNNADVFHSNTETLIVVGSQGNNVFNVNQNNILALIAGDDGDDTINVGNGNFAANITGDVLVGGGAGADLAIIHDTANAGSNTWTITSGATTHNGASASLLTSFFGPTIDAVQINTGAGSSTFNINSLGSASISMNMTINAGAGNDTFNVAASSGNISANLLGEIMVNGQAGTDALNVNDINDSGADSYVLNLSNMTKSDWAFNLSFPLGTLEALVLDANNAANTITVNSTFGENVTVRGNGGNDFIDVLGNSLGTFLTVDGGAGNDSISVNSDSSGQASVQFINSQTLSALRVFNGGRARLNAGANKVINTNSLLVSPTGWLDLADNAMIIDYAGASPIATIQSYLTNGYNGGLWNGTGGINSSAAAATTDTAIGFAEASEIFSSFPASFAGQNVDNTAVLLKHTFYGDATLDGNVNLADFNRLAANFGATPRRWVHGDFNFDALVNLSDFNRLAGNFGASGLVPDGLSGSSNEKESELPSIEELQDRLQSEQDPLTRHAS